MANPNIVSVASIYGSTSYLVPTTTSATTWTALTPSSNTVNKINTIVASNVTASNATITVSINSASGGGGTAYRLAYQITVPGNASLIISDKCFSLFCNFFSELNYYLEFDKPARTISFSGINATGFSHPLLMHS